MSKYLSRFKSCGNNVIIEHNVFIEHPEVIEVGDNVKIMSGLNMSGKPDVCRIGTNVTFGHNCIITGSPRNFIVGDNVTFYSMNYISLGNGADSFVEIGHDCHFAPFCVLYGGGGLRIGPYCNIAAHTVFATVGHSHEVSGKPMAKTFKTGPITLEEDIWIAANATITANTKIAAGCVVGANAVVTKDTEPMGIYLGIPARRIRDR